MQSTLFRLAHVAASIYLLIALPGSALAQDFVIGVIAGLTGHGAPYGAGIKQGAEMAVDEINRAGGIRGRKVRLQVIDDASEPARSAIAMRRLISTGADVIVGGWGSAQVLAHLDFAEQSAMPYIVVGATNPRVTRAGNRWVFRVIQTDSVMATDLAALAVRQLGLKRIAVINDSNAYGSANRDIFVEAVRALGVQVVESQSYEPSETRFDRQLQRVQAARPDAIAIFGTLPAAPAVMKQARALGITARFLGTGGLANRAVVQAAPEAMQGTVLMTFFSEEIDHEARAWAERYRRDYAAGRPVATELAAWEYRAIRTIVAPCLQVAGDDRVALRDCIAAWHGRPFGIADEVRFDRTGQLVQRSIAVEVRDGAFHHLAGTQ